MNVVNTETRPVTDTPVKNMLLFLPQNEHEKVLLLKKKRKEKDFILSRDFSNKKILAIEIFVC